MNHHDVRLLQQIQGYPAVTITLPTHHSFPDNKQDAIRVANLARQAIEHLLTLFSKREVEPLLVRIEKLVQSIDYRNTLDGLALFINSDFGRAVYLPFVLKERVVVDRTFFTRDLVFALNRSPRYWTLVLSAKPTRLFEGVHADLAEIREGGFPMTHGGPGGALPLPGGFGIRKSAYRDERFRQFFRKVDTALKPYLSDDPLPLAVAGVDRHLAFFKEVTQHNESIITTLTGSHDKTSPHELGKIVWPLVKENLSLQRQQALFDLEKAVGERNSVSTIGEVWRYAREGRGHLLIVEENYHFPARLDAEGINLIPVNDGSDPEALPDAVDEIIEMVMSRQGKVIFTDDGSLERHQKIALILRF